MITRIVTNVGAPLVDGKGAPAAQTRVRFYLVDEKGKPTDAWDVISGERVLPGPVEVLTDENGEFSISLWPTSRGDRILYWLCMLEGLRELDFLAPLIDGEGDLQWAVLKAGGSAPTPQQYKLWVQTTSGVATKAQLDAAAGAYEDGECLVVTNDPTPANNGTWRKEGAGWVQASFDRVATAEGRILAVENRTTAVEGRASAVEARAATVEGRTTTAEGKVSALETRANNSDTRATTIENRATALENRATNVEGRATAVEGRATAIEGREAAINAQINYHLTTFDHSAIPGLVSRMDTLEAGQDSGMMAYQTRAALFADLTPADRTPALVTNDPNPDYNGIWWKNGANSWTQASKDRVSNIEDQVAALNLGEVSSLAVAGGRQTETATINGGLRLGTRSALPMVTFIDDDSPTSVYTTLLPIFASRNVPCCCAAISSKTDTPTGMTTAQLLSLQNDYGWEIMSHTVNHPHLDELTAEGQEPELANSRDQLQALGLKVESVVYPYGGQNATTRKLARKHYRAAFGGYTGLNAPPFVSYKLERYQISNAGTLDQYKAVFDAGLAAGNWIVFYHHIAYDLDAAQQAILGQLIDYIKASNTPIVTAKTALDLMGNLVDIGDYPNKPYMVWDCNGDLYSSRTEEAPIRLATNGVTADSPLTAFPAKVTSICDINIAGQGTFPTPGALVTYRTASGAAWGRQTLYGIRGAGIYSRGWDDLGGGVWTAWTRLDVESNVGLTTTLNASTLATAWPAGKITERWYNAAGALADPGLPDLGPGILVTNLLHNGDSGAYCVQTYTRTDTTAWYMRTYNYTTGAWRAWIKQTVSYTELTAQNAYGATTPWTSFPQGKITVTMISSTGDKPVLDGVATYGVLTTYNHLNSSWACIQDFVPVNTQTTWRRRATSDTTWGPWTPNFPAQYVPPGNLYGNATALTSFPLGQVTLQRITASGDRPTPDGAPLSGVLRTFRLDPLYGYNWQEFDAYQSSDKWKRLPASDTTWGPWVKLTPTLLLGSAVGNTYGATTPLNGFPPGKITKNLINGVGDRPVVGGVASAGMLTTHYLEPSAYGWNWQEFDVYQSTDRWKRIPTSNTTWGPWVKIG